MAVSSKHTGMVTYTQPGLVLVGKPRSRRILCACAQAAVAVGLGLIILLGAFLRFYELGAHSIGNMYYAATVQSMLTSWHNFFFAAFEPGSSVSVDKPPLGLWVQAASAYVLGVNGFALALPQALAGVLSIPLLYVMVRRVFGAWVGLIAALALAVTPVALSTERNNTMDGLLMWVLLLAAWAFLRAARTGRFRDLCLGVVLVGLGFNIKMLQAFLPLPALYAVYFFGARHRGWKRIAYLVAATVMLLAVSLSWAVVVDLTPAENRPYVGGSQNNTVMELILGHNGLSRLAPVRGLAPSGAPPVMGNDGSGKPLPPPGGPQPGQFPPGPDDGTAAQPGQNRFPPNPDTGDKPWNPVQSEVGQPGAWRLLTEPLVTQASWLLPLALLGIPLVLALLGWHWPLSERHLALVLWCGWLLPELVYFSFTSGLFHTYYLIMLGAPLAALVGAVAWALGELIRRRRWLGWALLALLAGITLVFQIVTLKSYPVYAVGITAAAVAMWLVGIGLLAWRPQAWLDQAALALVCLSLMAAPLRWSALTTLNSHPDVALPRAGPDTGQSPLPNATAPLSSARQTLLDYLLANTDPGSYLVATLDAMDAAPYILATGRPVLTFGGFTGSDNVVDAERLAQMVADSQVRFVLDSPPLTQQKPAIATWLTGNCTVVTLPGTLQSPGNQPPGPGGMQPISTLYDCGNR